MAQDPYRYFRLEAGELLTQLAEGVLGLEKSDDSSATIQLLLRLAHTLKGAARVVKLPAIADRAHAIEDELLPFRDGGMPVRRQAVDALLRHIDEIGRHVPALTPPETAAPAKPVLEEEVRTVRADILEMDALLDGVSETQALLDGLRGAAQSVEQARHQTDLLLEHLAPNKVRQEAWNPERAFAMVEDLRRNAAGLERRLTFAVDRMDRELQQLRDAAEQLRLVSVATLLVALERTARDSALALSKQVVFHGSGGDIRLDAHVLAVVQTALVQLVRNAVAHGIESDGERRRAGKPPIGSVSVLVARRGRRIVFECRDDGGGVDLAAVRRAALRRGLSEAEMRRLGAADLLRMLMRGGISTAETVTEVSGRGVGLDVVRAAVERLGGEVAVHTELGQGTVFELSGPLSLASVEVLLVEASGTVAAIPLDAVHSTLLITASALSQTGTEAASVLFQGQAIPFLSLPAALHLTRQTAGRRWPTVLVKSGGLAAIGVDRLLGPARVVVRPLPGLVRASPIVAGASLDSQGTPQLVLDPDGLVAEARRTRTGVIEPVPPALPVLVIDDSLTTRMLEQNILVSAGFEVDLAVSGEDGLERARAKRYALFLVDVEMPGIDGFTFVERARADPTLRDIPAILVTSRNLPEDFQRGREVGAKGYIVKSEFDQAALLAMIRPLLR